MTNQPARQITTSDGTKRIQVKDASDEEFAAISIAMDQLMAEPSVEEEVRETAEDVWKFANRWWSGSRAAKQKKTANKKSGFFRG